MKKPCFPLLRPILLFLAVSLPCAVSARVLNVCDDVAEPLTLDPMKQFSEKNYTICWQIFDGLVRFDPDGKIEPALAVSWERIEPTRMRFKLREGVRFHNGEPFDSASVKFSIERYLDPRTGFPGLYFVDSMDHAEVVDPLTVDIVTKYPDGLLLNRLAGLVLIVPPGYLKEMGSEYFARHPVGTGAFVFREWEKGRFVRMEANREYWRKGVPRTKGLVFKFIPYERQLSALFSGEVDLLTDLPGTQTRKVMETPGFAVQKKASFYTMPSTLNLSSGPLSNLEVRKALNHAVSRENLIRYDLMGNGYPLATLSMNGEFGHNASLQPYEFDPEKARRLMKKAGYPDGFSLKFLVKKNAERIAKIVASDLKRIKVDLDITLVSDADMVREFGSGKYDIFIADVPDPLCHAYFVQSIVLFSGSPYAWGGDKKFDEMLVRMVSTMEPGAARKMAEEIDKYVYDNAMSLFTYQKTAVYGQRKGLRFTPFLTRMPHFGEAYFDEEKTQDK